MTDNQVQIKKEYEQLRPRLDRFSKCLQEQIENLLTGDSISLDVPIETRVKNIESIVEKIERKALPPETKLFDIDDLVGLRLILLFHRDLESVKGLIEKTFAPVQCEDTATRLGESEFGYQSHHYVITMPDAWQNVPSMADFAGLKAEIQVRTLSQHIWAVASHKLQYKHENDVPASIRRAIYRVSALLEVVDLEFERVLSEKEDYLQSPTDNVLNVDSLQKILTEIWPPENFYPGSEDYSRILKELQIYKINTPKKLKQILAKQKEAILKIDKKHVEAFHGEIMKGDPVSDRIQKRIEKGVFFSQVGLTRKSLFKEMRIHQE